MLSLEILQPRKRDEWLLMRRDSIGASEIPALFGHGYCTPFELFHRKRGDIPEQETTPAMERGTLLEAFMVDILLPRERPSWTIRGNKDNTLYRDSEARVHSTPDALADTPAGRACVQIKSVHPQAFRATWRTDTGEIEPPLHVAIQASLDAFLTYSEKAYVAAIVVDQGVELHICEIPMNHKLLARAKELAGEFWQRIAENDPYPPEYERDGAAIAALFADDDGGEIDLSGNVRIAEAIDARRRLQALEKAGTDAAKARKEIDAELLFALGNAAQGLIGNGEVIKAKTVRRAAYQVKETSYRAIMVKELKI